MGNSTSRVVGCFVPAEKAGVNLEFLEPLDEGLGHSFCYVRPGLIAESPAITPSNSERYTLDSSTLDSETRSGSFRQEVVEDLTVGLQRPGKNYSETTFRTISGASVSANASSARTGNPCVSFAGEAPEPAASFESTASFAAVPLQPVPRGSGPLNGFLSGPLERGFASGPLDRGAGFMSGPLDKGVFMSGPLDGGDRSNFSAPLSCNQRKAGLGQLVRSMSRPMKSALSRTFSRHSQGPGWLQKFLLHPVAHRAWSKEAKRRAEASRNGLEVGLSETEYSATRNLQWAHGKAGEDRVHVVLSEEQGWLFIGIYDGFSGPDAPDFLMSNLYKAIDKELEGLLWDYEDSPEKSAPLVHADSTVASLDPPNKYGIRSEIDTDKLEQQPENSEEQTAFAPNQCDEGFLQSQSNSNRDVQEASTTKISSSQKLDADEIVEEKAGPEEANKLQCGTSCSCSTGLRNTDLNIASCSCTTENRTSCNDNAISLKQCRKSKRLFELLQMELLEEYDRSMSKLPLERGNKTGMWDLQPGTAEGLLNRESYATAQPAVCLLSSKGECSDHSEEPGSSRQGDGVSGIDPKECNECSVSSSSSLGQKQMIRRYLFGSKLRKMYRKQKSLRKKFFPWSYDWHRDQPHGDESIHKPSEIIRRCKSGPVEHDAVLKAMSRALETTEAAYMEIVEKELDKNPELALMGSCVLVMLMKDQDVYVMNIGDSRVILAQDRLTDQCNNSSFSKGDLRYRNRSRESLVRVELDRISEESPMHNPNSHISTNTKNKELSLCRLKMKAVQLSTDHSTSIEEELSRIKSEHTDDPQAVFKDRVKGQLKVTRAFGAGFLKKPKFNDALLEMFRIDYVGTSPYISCDPSVLHHHLCSSDRFLVLSSDGLYQYFTNDEVVSHVAWFMENVPEGDPAQYLVAELLCRAAKKNGLSAKLCRIPDMGSEHLLLCLQECYSFDEPPEQIQDMLCYPEGMDFHELLDIPQGDRRKYHDDVSVMVISLEGRIWRSSG